MDIFIIVRGSDSYFGEIIYGPTKFLVNIFTSFFDWFGLLPCVIMHHVSNFFLNDWIEVSFVLTLWFLYTNFISVFSLNSYHRERSFFNKIVRFRQHSDWHAFSWDAECYFRYHLKNWSCFCVCLDMATGNVCQLNQKIPKIPLDSNQFWSCRKAEEDICRTHWWQ